MEEALVIGELLKMSDEFQSEQQRIKDEGNRKRAEAAKAQESRGNRYTSAKEEILEVVPQTLAPPLKPSCPIQSPPSVVTPTPPTPIQSTPQTPLSVTAKPPVYAPPPKVEIPEPPKPANINADRPRSHSVPSGAHLTDLTATSPYPRPAIAARTA
jgi:hypothetical protein